MILKVCFISTSDIDGGAARAAYRLHLGLLASQVRSDILVQEKLSYSNYVHGPKGILGDIWSFVRAKFDMLPIIFYKDFVRKSPWSVCWIPFAPLDFDLIKQADIVHLHWVGRGFVPVSILKKIKKPIVWTLHDKWAFTGGCHVTGNCLRYERKCGHCPQLGSNVEMDLSRWVWSRKNKKWKDLNISIVTPSKWMGECARRSGLFKNCHHEVIPNGIDTNLFKSLDKYHSRKLLNLPKDSHLVLFGGMKALGAKHKGFQYLVPALENINVQKTGRKVELVVFGDSEPVTPLNLGMPIHYLGRINDEVLLPVLYSAVDVVVTSFLEDNFPNVVLESMSCGTPCVAFELGGTPEMIDHLENGYLAQPCDSDDLTRGIEWVLGGKERWHSLSAKARKKVETNYSIENIAKKYIELYESILSN